MAMAYCRTCGAVGNWFRCPMDGVDDDGWSYQKHYVQYDESYQKEANREREERKASPVESAGTADRVRIDAET